MGERKFIGWQEGSKEQDREEGWGQDTEMDGGSQGEGRVAASAGQTPSPRIMDRARFHAGATLTVEGVGLLVDSACCPLPPLPKVASPPSQWAGMGTWSREGNLCLGLGRGGMG